VNVLNYFEDGPDGILEYLYGYTGKRYTKREVDPKLKGLFTYIDLASSLIECEHADSRFIHKMLKSVALVMMTFKIDDISDDAKENWIVKLIIITKRF
jgi:hypothetical protein